MTGENPIVKSADSQNGDGEPNWPLLAGLRFFLAATIFNLHAGLVGCRNGFGLVFAGGAVAAFFVISGFSMAHSLSRGAKGFYERRFYRIWPLYMLGISLALVPMLRGGGFYRWPHDGILCELPDPKTFVGNALLLQPGFFTTLASNPASWSLGIEAAFYLLVPFYGRLNRRKRMSILCACAAFALVAGGQATFPNGIRFFPYIGLWLLFGLGFEFHAFRHEARLQLATLALAMIAGVGTPSMGISLWLILRQSHISIPPRWQRVLLYLGELSYPLYILHDPVMAILNQAAPKAPDVAYYGAGLLVAMAAYHLFDAPLRRWNANRQKLRPRLEAPA